MDVTTVFYEFLKFFNLNDPATASGWLVSCLMCGFMIWRLIIMDKKQDEYVDKVTKIIEKQEEEWRSMVSKNDDLTFEMLQTSTQTLSVLSEKINTLQLLLLQFGNDKK